MRALLLLFGLLLPEVVLHGPRDPHSQHSKKIALTFDACMSPGMSRRAAAGQPFYDPAIVDFLRRSRTPATFFLSGLWIERYPEVTRELGRDPLFELGNHSYSHRSFARRCFRLPPLGAGEDRQEVERTQELLQELAGVRPRFFRFPGGCQDRDRRDAALLAALGLRAVNWDVYSQDGRNPDPSAIERSVLGAARAGSIVLFHLLGAPNAPRTAAALPRIVARLREEGYTMVRLGELLPADKSQ